MFRTDARCESIWYVPQAGASTKQPPHHKKRTCFTLWVYLYGFISIAINGALSLHPSLSVLIM